MTCVLPKVAIKHTSLQELLKEDPGNHWKPLPLAQFLQCWQSYGQQILAATPGMRFQSKFCISFRHLSRAKN